MTDRPDVLTVVTEDRHRFELRVYEPHNCTNVVSILILPAMGVRASFYEPIARAFADVGLRTVLMDLRGIDGSSIRASWSQNFGYREIVGFDLGATVGELSRRWPDDPIFFLGHSLGGQLGCLYVSANPGVVSGLILIGSCSVYYQGWEFPHNLGLLALQHFALLTAHLLGYYPGRLVGFGGREARGLIADWARQGRTGRYLVDGHSFEYDSLLRTVTLPILSIRLTDDFYAPEAAVEHLLGKMDTARCTRLALDPGDVGVERLGHFGWAKEPQAITPRVVDWVRTVQSRA